MRGCGPGAGLRAHSKPRRVKVLGISAFDSWEREIATDQGFPAGPRVPDFHPDKSLSRKMANTPHVCRTLSPTTSLVRALLLLFIRHSFRSCTYTPLWLGNLLDRQMGSIRLRTCVSIPTPVFEASGHDLRKLSACEEL